MPLWFRIVLTVLGVTALVFALGFIFNVQGFVRLWPYGGSIYDAAGQGLGRIFVASIFASVGAPIILAAVSDEIGGIRAGAVNAIAFSLLLAIHAIVKTAEGLSGRVAFFAALNVATIVGLAIALRLTRNIPIRDTRPTPVPVRIAFGVFALLLIPIGIGLISGVPLFPWTLSQDNSIAYGILFASAALYFVYAIVRPVYGMAKGQLMGFLFYDLVLIGPLFMRWPTGPENLRVNLAVYLIVIIVSGLIAIWYLLLDPKWRLGSLSARSRSAPASA